MVQSKLDVTQKLMNAASSFTGRARER